MRDDKDINVGRRNMTASRTMEYTTINLTRTRSIVRRTRDDEDTNRLMQQKQARAADDNDNNNGALGMEDEVIGGIFDEVA